MYHSSFHPALDDGHRPLKSFTVYLNTHIFGLSIGLDCLPWGGGGGLLNKGLYRRLRPEVVRLSEARNEEWRPSTIFKDVLFDDSR